MNSEDIILCALVHYNLKRTLFKCYVSISEDNTIVRGVTVSRSL